MVMFNRFVFHLRKDVLTVSTLIDGREYEEQLKGGFHWEAEVDPGERKGMLLRLAWKLISYVANRSQLTGTVKLPRYAIRWWRLPPAAWQWSWIRVSLVLWSISPRPAGKEEACAMCLFSFFSFVDSLPGWLTGWLTKPPRRGG